MSETKEERRNSIAIFRQNESIKPKAYNKTLNVQVSNLLMNNKSFDNIKAMRANQIVSWMLFKNLWCESQGIWKQLRFGELSSCDVANTGNSALWSISKKYLHEPNLDLILES